MAEKAIFNFVKWVPGVGPAYCATRAGVFAVQGDKAGVAESLVGLNPALHGTVKEEAENVVKGALGANKHTCDMSDEEKACAIVARAAYFPNCVTIDTPVGFLERVLFVQDGNFDSTAVIFQNDEYCIFGFKGTNSPTDWAFDALFVAPGRLADYVIPAHLQAVGKVGEDGINVVANGVGILDLYAEGRKKFMTGHSLGGYLCYEAINHHSEAPDIWVHVFNPGHGADIHLFNKGIFSDPRAWKREYWNYHHIVGDPISFGFPEKFRTNVYAGIRANPHSLTNFIQDQYCEQFEGMEEHPDTIAQDPHDIM